ncbi:unnamed protein product, partial [Prorocentrum cordatum]
MALQARQEEQILQYIEESNSSGRLASGWDQLKEFLLAEGLAYYQQVPPNQMGIDIRNRSGSLVNPARARNLGAKICAQGFVLAKTAAAAAFEAPQGAQLEETAMANDPLSRLSGGRCPPLDSLRYTSVGGSHTNVFLRCVLAKAPTTVKALADSRDNIDSEKLCALHPQLATAVKKGLTWLIIKHAVAKVKGLKNFVQRALNADVREAVHETEIIRSGGRMLLAHSLAEGSSKPDWRDIAEQAGHANPPCKAWIADLCKFVELGPQNGELLREIDEALKTFTNVDVSGQTLMCGSEFWRKLNSIKWGKHQESYPHVVAALVKANYSGEHVV